ncbi:ABC transporter substrate-binding protein [Streptomyces sp. NPDC001020]
MIRRVGEWFRRLGRALRHRWRVMGPLGHVVTGVVVLVVVAVVVLGTYRLTRPELSCAAGVARHSRGAECIGVTDGWYSFSGQLDAVSARIAEENRRAEKSPYVTIALVLPMAAVEPFERHKVLEQVQGAYLAQYRANELSNDQTPKIRLLLANAGRNHEYWRQISDDLAGRAATKENLRAVLGFDVSVAATKQAIEYLTVQKGIPVVAGPVTAADIGPYRGFARIVPTTSDQAQALASYAKGTDPRTTLVVEDQRDDDNYISELRNAFHRLTAGSPRAPERYYSPDDFNADGNTSTVFRQMVTSLCGSKAKVLYFAGRPVQLRQLINELGQRPCVEKTYKIITGSGASTITSDPKLDWGALSKGVTVQYAANAHPGAWKPRPGMPRTGGSPAAFTTLQDLTARAAYPPAGRIGPVSLTDSRTIIAYDAALTAVTAVRANAVGQGSNIPSLEDIRSAWLRLHGTNKVEGASGWICLDNHGNPYDKAVSVVQLDPRTKDLDFVATAWPNGAPPAADCTAARS